MSNYDFKDKSSLYILGKELVIVVVVVFSSLSFALGYFVGKSRIQKIQEPPVQVAEMEPVQQKQDTRPIKTAEQPAIQTEAQSAKTEIPKTNSQAGQFQESRQNAPHNKSKVQTESKQPESLKETLKEVKVSTHTDNASNKKKKAYDSIYSVQLGAFKNESDAESLKKEYINKGYKVYIVVSKNNRNVKIYKVCTGEFKEKKHAEVLSLKLKKTEGLNTFVTIRKE